MRRLAWAVATLGALAAVPAPASANPADSGCVWVAVDDPTGEVLISGAQHVVIDRAGVRCWIEVDGAPVNPTATSPDSVVGAEFSAYSAPEGSVVVLCEQVDGDAVFCRGEPDVTVLPAPPEEVYHAIDPTICLVSAAVFPPQGDMPEIGWDCPPYDV